MIRAEHLSRLTVQPVRRKWLWGVAGVWAALHLIALIGLILFSSDYTRDNARSWSDFVTYVDAGEHVQNRQSLYELDGWEDVMAYHYHPTFALLVSLFSSLPFRFISLLWMGVLATSYGWAVYIWFRVLEHLNLTQAMHSYWVWLPVTLVFTEWYANLIYGNVAGILFFLSGLLSFYIIREKPTHAGAVAVLIALLKPQWLFPLLLPIVFRRWKFLLVLVGVLVLGYALASLLFVAVTGSDYSIDTLREYFKFLTVLNDVYPWTGDTQAFEDMNHSWRQIFLSYFGFQDWIPYASEGIKIIMAALVGGLVLRTWQQKIEMQQKPFLVLCFLALGYLLTMAFLAQLWELLAGIVFFLFLQSIQNSTLKKFSWLFLLYVFYELIAITGFATGIEWLFLPQSIPLTMLALLVLFGAYLWVTVDLLQGKTP